jgi:hypothetical protein
MEEEERILDSAGRHGKKHRVRKSRPASFGMTVGASAAKNLLALRRLRAGKSRDTLLPQKILYVVFCGQDFADFAMGRADLDCHAERTSSRRARTSALALSKLA